jgi:hypothetical protein
MFSSLKNKINSLFWSTPDPTIAIIPPEPENTTDSTVHYVILPTENSSTVTQPDIEGIPSANINRIIAEPPADPEPANQNIAGTYEAPPPSSWSSFTSTFRKATNLIIPSSLTTARMGSAAWSSLLLGMYAESSESENNITGNITAAILMLAVMGAMIKLRGKLLYRRAEEQNTAGNYYKIKITDAFLVRNAEYYQREHKNHFLITEDGSLFLMQACSYEKLKIETVHELIADILFHENISLQQREEKRVLQAIANAIVNENPSQTRLGHFKTWLNSWVENQALTTRYGKPYRSIAYLFYNLAAGIYNTNATSSIVLAARSLRHLAQSIFQFAYTPEWRDHPFSISSFLPNAAFLTSEAWLMHVNQLTFRLYNWMALVDYYPSVIHDKGYKKLPVLVLIPILTTTTLSQVSIYFSTHKLVQAIDTEILATDNPQSILQDLAMPIAVVAITVNFFITTIMAMGAALKNKAQVHDVDKKLSCSDYFIYLLIIGNGLSSAVGAFNGWVNLPVTLNKNWDLSRNPYIISTGVLTSALAFITQFILDREGLRRENFATQIISLNQNIPVLNDIKIQPAPRIEVLADDEKSIEGGVAGSYNHVSSNASDDDCSYLGASYTDSDSDSDFDISRDPRDLITPPSPVAGQVMPRSSTDLPGLLAKAPKHTPAFYQPAPTPSVSKPHVYRAASRSQSFA